MKYLARFLSADRIVKICLLTLVAGPATAAADDGQEAKEAAFRKMLSGVTMTGSFTVDGRESEAPKAESYRIESVRKVTGNLWTFTTQIKYGKVDARLPITVPVEWAGDTPMVSLTNATIPGLGEAFSARVVFHDGRYAGTWQHGQVGGHMFGSIKADPPKASAKSSPANSPK